MAAEDEDEEFKTITAEEFADLLKQRDAGGDDAPDFTVVDLREPDELIVFGIEGALNIPFAQVAQKLDEVPQGKPVYVICRTGDWSEQVAELLADRGYEAYNVEGGTQALRPVLAGKTAGKAAADASVANPAAPAAAPAASEPPAQKTDAAGQDEPLYVDARGLRCPGPIVKVADTLRGLEPGQAVYVEATEDAFASDIAVWAERTGNVLENLEVQPDLIKATVRKSDGTAPAPATAGASAPSAQADDAEHEKTFVVFSGDLDKTIAAFIMANGGAAMGRKVTMFFTFWGLNVLRKPEKVKVKKNFIEKMFGFMMPRGTKKLGLSRMNMLGLGPKMIRSLMKQKGISSLEELIDDARAHGVRLVACQMSMDIMGIKKEELIDGVELGGVATMLGSAEKSDLTYFI